MPARRLVPAAVALVPVAAVAGALVASTAAVPAAAAQQVDVIRGRVLGPDRQPVENAQVTATSISGNVNRTARTDRNGRYTITFPGGDGDYFVTFTALGLAPRRYQVKRLADEDFLLADATLQRAANTLDAVRVTAARDRVSRADAGAPDLSGTERRTDPALVAPDQMGDLAAMAAAQPGVTPVPGADGDPAGFSVLGLSADQNQTTLNGMNFGGNNLPRDAQVTSSLVTSPWDVSTGGFSGGRFNLRTRPGTNYQFRNASLFGTGPFAQWSDPAARALGQEGTNLSLSGSVSGPLRHDKAFYNVAYQLGRQANDLRTLLDTDPVGLQAAGVAADSVRRLTAILGRQGVPTTVPSLGGNRLADQGSLFGAFDLTPPSSSSGQSFNVTVNGAWNRQTPASQLATEYPAHTGDRTSWNAGVQGRHSSYLRNIFLSETTLNLTGQRSWGSPYVLLPGGTVLVNSTFDDGTTGVRSIAFGGNPWMNTSQRSTSAGVMNQLSWFSANNRHRLKLATELRRDGFAQDMTTNLRGSFAYNSLADLEAGRPASFTRQLAPRVREGDQWVAALSLGDSWRAARDLQLQYGVRLDANRFGARPAFNPDVERTFGTRNDRAPGRVYASPRFGFAWTYGTAPQVSGFDGAVRGPRAVVRGGVGLFQNVPQTALLGNAIDNTGLPGAVQQLACVGAAAPAVAWSAWAANAAPIPSTCADGTAGTPFAASVPNVTLFADDWRAPRSLRSSLSWSGPVLGNRLNGNVEGTLSRNTRQAGFVDRNVATVPRFTLAAEDGRPVYVPAASIVPGTGATTARDARVSPLFQRVAEQRSDLGSTSQQLRVGISPLAFNTRFGWSLSYVWQNVRERTRGFQSSAGDPWAVERSRAAFDPRHQVVYSLNWNIADAVRLSWFGNIRSGLPFTPVVGGDVNGDGYQNDRAFVFDPTAVRATDPALADAMQGLLDGGPRAARDCLQRQLGVVAARNGCTGPWTQTANLQVALNPLKFRMPQRTTLSFALSNPLGAVDRLLHGEAGQRGWGQTPQPDASLLYVRGFDAERQRWRYEVNQRFGATRPQASAFRQPVTLTMMLRVDVGPTRERQNLTQALDRGRRLEGQKAPEPFLRAMYGSGGLQNPLAQILRQADTLRLDGRQADSIATLNRWYSVRVDSIWAPLMKEFAALPDDYAHDAAYDRYRTARRATVDLLARLAPDVRALLTAEQRRRLPPMVASMLDTRYLAAIRSGTAGAGGLPMFGGMGGFGGGMGGGGPVGGGNQTVIIR